MSKIGEQLTSVSVNTETFNDFKRESVGTITNLKKLVEFSMKLYLVDSKYKSKVDNFIGGGVSEFK